MADLLSAGELVAGQGTITRSSDHSGHQLAGQLGRQGAKGTDTLPIRSPNTNSHGRFR